MVISRNLLIFLDSAADPDYFCKDGRDEETKNILEKYLFIHVLKMYKNKNQ